ncbi:MAG TPA: sulfotransferase [Stellaceae bacterium]|nr:sulfotransferase [Stellaceae bacterium]
MAPKPDAATLPDIRDKRLVFLIGAPRSGTTWLQILLSSSPAVATFTETHLFSTYTASLFAGWRTFENSPDPVGLKMMMSKEEFLGLVREITSAVMSRILMTRPTASVILEKTPFHACCCPDILAVYPDAYFLHIVRDPRAVVASMRAARQWGGSGWASPWLADNCEFWRKCVEEARAMRAATSRYLEIRYEDLVDNGIPTLRQVFRWMEIDEPEPECARILEANRIDNLRNQSGDGTSDFVRRLRELYGGGGTSGFFRRGEVDGWRQDLTPRQVQLIERMTGKIAVELGYEPTPNAAFDANRVIVACMLAAERIRSGLKWRVKRLVDAR